MLVRLWNRLPWYAKNRYVVTTMLFVIWLAFFDQHNMISQIEFKAELYRLNQDKAYYQQAIIEIREDLEELLSDDRKLERFARERYYMKKPSEEIFVFVSEEEE
ncbi:MAG: septum formation initiator family protein [Salibacteraceae bacterium]